MTGIRADANEVTATGHIMRCVTIARQIIKRGESVLFFVADEYAFPLLEAAGMEYVCLHTRWEHMESELPVLKKELKRTGCHRLLVDSYQATSAYLAALGEQVPVAYIDDMFETVYPVRLLINYNAYYSRFPYEESYGRSGKNNTRLLLGTSYVPLREEFSQEWSSIREIRTQGGKEPDKKLPDGGSAFHVLVSCGGGDTQDALTGILSCALHRKELRETVFHTVVGRFNRNAAGLEEMAKEQPRLKLYYNVTNMAELMAGCDAAVSAAGTVLYELCAMRVPSVFFVCADNQEYDSCFFAAEERMLFAGDIRPDRETCIGRLCNGVERLAGEPLLRAEMKEKLGKVTDGRGAARIAEELLKL